MSLSDIGIYGLGVMGRNLALNLEEKGFTVSVYNRIALGEEMVIDDFLYNEGSGKKFNGSKSVGEFVQSIEKPRKIMLMVKAGKPVDLVGEELLPHLDNGDIIIDGGNSNFNDTEHRVTAFQKKGVHFVGMGVSGGEEGARRGPSLMPGGDPSAWPAIKLIFQKIAAKTFDGAPCCEWIGQGGAGHFVKMVHNGIEYADMQLIAEVYHFMKEAMSLSPSRISKVFFDWNKTELESYLLEISAKILTVNDSDSTPLIDKILDSAGQKGTGKWTAITALEIGTPISSITQAVNARFISSFKELRTNLQQAKSFTENPLINMPENELIETMRQALLASRMAVYAEGFHMMQNASDEFEWDIDLKSVAEIWQGGCIIQSRLLTVITEAFQNNHELVHLLLDNHFRNEFNKLEESWRKASCLFIRSAIPAPCFMASLAQTDSIQTGYLPANLIQAQRDYFGAHTYERTDNPRGKFFHTDWANKIK